MNKLTYDRLTAQYERKLAEQKEMIINSLDAYLKEKSDEFYAALSKHDEDAIAVVKKHAIELIDNFYR